MFDGKNLRKKLQAGRTCLGTWSHSSDPCEVELLCGSGFDFVIVDAEHGALTIQSIQASIMAGKGTNVAILVRVPWNDPVIVKQVLDAGADGILVPMVNSAEAARQAVAACLYPPLGVRGWGPRRPSNYERDDFNTYLNQAHENLVIWVQVEHIEAVRSIQEIVRTPRLDGVLIGASDLSISMGLLGQAGHPQLIEAITQTIAAAKEADLPVGMAGPGDPQAAFEWLEKGLQFITLSSAIGFLIAASQAAVSGVQKLLEERR